jgi:acetyl-CoA carboxylase biotin carboxyl carrier protein
MAILGFELEEIVRLIALLESSGLSEIYYQDGDRSIRIRGPRPVKPQAVVMPVEPSVVVEQRRKPERKPKAIAPPATPADQVVLSSPMVGTFYRAEKPGAPPLIDVGQRVEMGQSIGVIEAMKVFSEIPAEHAGVVVSIPARDGHLVQTGEPLVILRSGV